MAGLTSINRREFLAAAAVVATGGASTFHAQEPAVGAAAWAERPMRWVQLVLVENDPGNYDPQFWLDFCRDSHADGACLSAGGSVAYYPTKIPLHHRSSFMKEGADPFGELVAGCRKMGMTVVARTDPHSILDDAAEAHPEWIAVDARGNKRRHWASPHRWVTCALGPYNFEFMTEVTKEIVRKYDVDGIFANRWQGHGVCHCQSCREKFKAFCGLEIPTSNNPADAAYRNWIEWSNDRLFELWRLWDGEIRKIRPQARYIANSGGGSMTSLDMKTIADLAPTLFADRQSRRGLMTPWANGKNGKEFRATFGKKPIVGIFSIGIDDDHRWKDSVQSEAEIRIWVADGIANGLRPWMAKFSGVLYDQRWVPIVRRLYEWHWKHERYLRNEANLARVAMVYSQQTGTYYGGTAKSNKVEDHELGMYQALVEARIPFEMAHDRMLEADQIDRYKLLILPNVAAVSNAQCDQLRRYVERGGSILATFETSLHDEWGKAREDFALADLFGVRYRGRTERDIKNSYIRIEAETRHPLIRGLEDAGRIINTVQRVDVEPVARFDRPPITRIPSYPDLPMEEVYPRVARTDTSEVFLRERGKSRIVYFPGDIDRTFWEVLSLDHSLLLRNAIEWAMNEPKTVEVTGPGLLDVTAWRQKDSMTVHLVNLTNPMFMKGPYRELISVPEQTVRINLPEGKQPSRIQLLVSGANFRAEPGGGALVVKTPSILDHEVIAIDF